MPAVRARKRKAVVRPYPFVEVDNDNVSIFNPRAVSPSPNYDNEDIKLKLCPVSFSHYLYWDNLCGGTMVRRKGRRPGATPPPEAIGAGMDAPLDRTVDKRRVPWQAALTAVAHPASMRFDANGPHSIPFPRLARVPPPPDLKPRGRTRGPYKKKTAKVDLFLPGEIATTNAPKVSSSLATPIPFATSLPGFAPPLATVQHDAPQTSQTSLLLPSYNVPSDPTAINAAAVVSAESVGATRPPKRDNPFLTPEVLARRLLLANSTENIPAELAPEPPRFTAAEKGKGRTVSEDDAIPDHILMPPPKSTKRLRAPASETKGPRKKATVGAASNTPEWFASRSMDGAKEGVDGEELDIEDARRGVRIRPRLKARPPVWAYSRQEICETLPWWRAFQSGLYMRKKTGLGYLLDSYPAPRDTWAHNGRVVVSHGGGKCVEFSDPNEKTRGRAKKKVALRADQSTKDNRVRALIKACKRRTPIALVAGNNYQGMPFDLGCGYVVLGWYWISYIWTEAEDAAPGSKLMPGRDYFHRIKVRFDWVTHQGEPWWTVEDPLLPNGWEPQAECAALKARRAATLPEGHRPRMNVKEDRTPVPTPAEVKSDAQASPMEVYPPTSSSLPSVTSAPLPVATSMAQSFDRAPVPDQQVTSESLPVSPPKPRARDKSLMSFMELDPFVISASSSSSGSQRASSPFEELHASSSASIKKSAQVSEDVSMDDAGVGATTTAITEVGASEAGPSPSADPAKPRRRLPGEGGIRKISSFKPPDITVVEKEVCEIKMTRLHRACSKCEILSPFIYDDGWICLNTECSVFFKLVNLDDDTLSTPPARMAFDPDFIAPLQSPAKLKHLPYPVVPPPPVEVMEGVKGPTSSRSYWRGMVCLQCNKASSRERWDRWECTGCQAIYAPLDECARVIKAKELIGDDEWERPSVANCTNYVNPFYKVIGMISDLLAEDDETPLALVHQYTLPDGGGVIYHIRPYNPRPYDEIFEAYQDTTSPDSATKSPSARFKRNSIRQHAAVGRLLTQQFSFNAGANYKYVVDQDDQLPFSEAPAAVMTSLQHINEIVQGVCGQVNEFNEILSVAYKDRQKMNWHDDGEHGLGPVVSSLSLGSDADMSFRLKKPKNKGKNNVYHVDAATRAVQAAAASASAAATPASAQRNATPDATASSSPQASILTPIPAKLPFKLPPIDLPVSIPVDDSDEDEGKGSKRGKGKGGKKTATKPKKPKKPPPPPKGTPRRPALILKLKHGDFVIMQGDLLQVRYEHMVAPKGFRIAATARTIMEGHGKPKPKPKAEKKPKKEKAPPKPRAKKGKKQAEVAEGGEVEMGGETMGGGA